MKLVAIALANCMARTVWALLKTGESYRATGKNTDPTGPTRWQDAKWDDGELTDNRIGTPRSDRSAK